jgi:Ser/Thr protein kinase RdoA (MazF antagonist)
MTDDTNLSAVLVTAAQSVGLDATGAEPIRLGENAIYRLPGKIVARISRPGQEFAAKREVAISHWLNDSGVPAVAAVKDIHQPVLIGGRPVTFWAELLPHQHGTPSQVAEVLKRLHALPVPADISMGKLDPFVRLLERIQAAPLSEGDRSWLLDRCTTLSDLWGDTERLLSSCVIHGDAWAGNIVMTEDGNVVLIDLERCSIGPPEWDLVSTAVKYTSFGGITRSQYSEFVATYGRDVVEWEHFELLRNIRELRVTCYAAQQALRSPRAMHEAELRVACLRGSRGPRPWTWTAV